MTPFNYRHLHYFWVVAREGGMARGAARLGMAVQTVSAQVRELEKTLGHSLLKPEGRRLVLTEAGELAMRQADLIFELGEQLPARLQQATETPVQRLQVGVSDGVPKLVVRRLLQPVMLEPRLRLRCSEGDFDRLLAELALHRLDIVLSDRPAPANPSLRLYSHALEASPLAWYAAPTLHAAARAGFPQSLASVPVLLPTPEAAARKRLDAWFASLSVRPNVVGEFDDSALLKTFGATGMGVFPAPALVHDELMARYAVKRLGSCDGVDEHYFAIGTERRVHHPLVQKLLSRR